MFPAFASLKEHEGRPHAAADRHRLQHQARGKWISALGWLLTVSGTLCVLIGFSDLKNLAMVVAMGIIFIPLGLLVIASGQILAGLAAIEKNTRKNDSIKDKASSGTNDD